MEIYFQLMLLFWRLINLFLFSVILFLKCVFIVKQIGSHKTKRIWIFFKKQFKFKMGN